MKHRVVSLLSLALLVAPVARAEDTFAGVDRIVAVGDVHGGYDELVKILREAGILDARNRWAGGKAHLVQTGDVVDRGAESRKVMDLLMELERQASRAGGRVHALIGNHEVMNLVGDLRYVSDGEYAAFRTQDSAELRSRAFELVGDPARKDDPSYRREWEASHPLGWVEHRQAFGSKGRYGKWLRSHNTIVRINDILFVHGGLSPKYAALTIREINDRVRAELADLSLLQGGLTTDEDGPLWYRGLAEAPEAELLPHLEQVLKLHGARHIVVGHTVVAPVIVPRFDTRVVAIDVGLSELYGGPDAALVVEKGRLFALHRGHRLELPVDAGLRAYLEAAARIDPAPSPLLKMIDRLAPLPADPATKVPGAALARWQVTIAGPRTDGARAPSARRAAALARPLIAGSARRRAQYHPPFRSGPR